MRIKQLTILFLFLSNLVLAQETLVPDDNFENYLETHDATGNVVALGAATSMGNGIANDNYVTTSKVANVVSLNISNLTITDATGIEAFTALEVLSCFNNALSSINLSQNLALNDLNVGKNNLTSLDITNNTALTKLSCSKNQLTSLDVSQNTQLETLGCSSNQLTSLDVTKNTDLLNLSCYNNPLGSLDVTKNLLLQGLDCVNTQLTSIDVSKNTELLELQVYENSLTSLDVSNNVKLIELYAEYNQITSLDVSKNTALVDLSCYNNQLTYLNFRNGNNTILDSGDFDIRNNPNLTCVSVDDPTYATANLTDKDAHTVYKTSCTQVNVPDDNFEAYLETHNNIGGVVPVGDPTSMGNGIANDNFVGAEQIKDITYLNISNQGITDFTGIEEFKALEELRAFNNTVTSGSLDLTGNVNLTEIACSDMGLSSINISGLVKLEKVGLRSNNFTTINLSTNTAVKYLYLDYNNLTAIDVSTNTALVDLRVRESSLTTLNLANNTNLTSLYCDDNLLTTIDVSNNTLLRTFNCSKNKFTSINVSGLTSLTDLFIDDTPTLTTLDVTNNLNLEDIGVNNTGLAVLDLTNNTKLIEVYANNTSITSLDFSNSPDIDYIECKDGVLTTLNLKNGNNSSSIELYATGNSNLLCIQVDDASASYLSSWNKESSTSFGEDCNWTYVPDDNFENYLETHDANNGFVSVGDPTSMGNGIANDNYVTTAKIKNVVNLFAQFQGITDFTGLEDFTDLEVLFIFNNVINTSLDVTSNTKLTRIDAGDMGITSINITGLTALERLSVPRNSFTSIDVSTNTGLKDLIISSNNLSGLDVSQNTLLEDLQIHETTLSTIDVSANVNLTRIIASLNQFTTLNLEKNTALERLNLAKNPFTSYNLSHLTNLKEINLDETNITSIDISKNTNLEEFSARNNNELVELNVRNGNNSSFTEFEVDGCPNLTCIEVNDPSAVFLSGWSKDATANYAEYCRFTSIPDANFETYLETHNQYGGSVALGSSNSLGNGVIDDNLVPTAKIETIQLLTPRNEGIQDFTGIEDFVSLIRLWIDNNTLTNTSLDLTNNKLLESLTLENTGVTSINVTGLTALESLEAANNSLTSLNITTNTGLKFLNLGDNNLTSLDVSNNDLTSLTVTNNQLGTLDVSNQTNLTSLYCENTNISSLNVQNNTLLENLECGQNSLTAIDVTALTDLFYLSFLNTNIATIDLSKNANLSRLVCDNTQLTTLDLSNQNTLDNLSCKNGLLTRLNLRSGNNSDLDNVDVTGNPNLTCISVDDPSASVLAGWLKDATASYAQYCRLTYVPDDVFEAFLESNGYGNGIANDNYVYTALVEVSEGIVFQNKTASDLTGIEDFRDAWYFVIRNNPNLTSIDLTQNTKLTTLSLANNNLSSLDLSKNTILEKAYLDNNTNLGDVNIAPLSQLNTLDVSNTGINSIDISNNPLLRVLNLNDNSFTSLDLSTYPSILQLRIVNNQLTSLNVANGNNTNFTWFDAQGNADLTCITVDDINPDSGIWHKDATANYALYCDLTNIPDANFENYLETHDANGNTVAVGNILSMGNGIANDNQVATSKIKDVTTLDISSQNISDITGIEAFTALESLNVDYNNLTSLDLSSNTSLKILDAAENNFTSLDLSGYLALEEVELRSNSIENLIVSNNPNLTKLRVGKNKLAVLDVTACKQLEELAVHQNVLVSLDVKNGNNANITDFVALYNSSLTCIEVDDAAAAYLATWQKDATTNFSENCNATVWLGTNNDNWNETSNWVANAKPQTTSNVIIPYRTNTPRLTSSEQINDLRITEFSSFDITENGSVKVDGNFNNSGTFTMTSTASNSASLLVEGLANGEVTYKRGGLKAGKWSIVSAPVFGQSIKEFVENSANNIRVNTSVTPNRYAVGYYDDSKPDGTKWVYYTVDDLTSNNIVFEKGRSYAISRATDGEVSFTGTVETIDVSKPVATSEWNAVGNPFTAFLPINENSGVNFINDNLANFDPTYVGAYVWDNSQNKYIANTLVSAESSLAPGQGFFVKTAAGANSIIFKEAQRKIQPASGGIFSKGLGESQSAVELSIATKGVKVNTVVSYRNEATKGLDIGYDVGNFDGASLDIYTQLIDGSSEKNFTYQSIPNTGEANIIPVGVKAKEGLEVTISAKATASEGMKVILEDKELDKYIDLSKENYTITMSKSENGIGRFYLHTQVQGKVPEDTVADIKIYSINRTLIVEGILGENFNISMYNLLGAEVFKGTYEGTNKNEIDLPKVETGVYLIKLETTEGTKNKKIILKK
ncbi:T9SS type A sorting domain-containing protein [uncultured Tenacibaculum sp.]|uniref:T9SS type A sorting domain-containing protein n=1 Tax=uncultured Tenacibaculum sp. TaxID=174713 RepID=UPI002613C6E7|nr:T9SS type A sorting domain-containing protein [uncultured Tenacibaculum sp.]